MAEIIYIALDRVTPTADGVLAAQGIPTTSPPGTRTRRLAEEAIGAFRVLAQPKGKVEEVAPDQFIVVYEGEGHNAAPAVLDQILPQAARSAAFVVTVGHSLTDRITELFSQNDFAAGTMLDAAASLGADLAAQAMEDECRRQWSDMRMMEQGCAVLRFSPGYCGWHISGQKRLFAFLRPDDIGVRLNESCLMQPLKSVSGVVVAAPVELFDIDDSFPFCDNCTTHSCRDRFAKISKKKFSP